MGKPYVSYKYLRDSAKSAVLASIEVYNKPALEYREETFVVLLVNAWELLLKALLAKNNVSVFYPKKRNEPYRTVSITHAMKRCQDNRLFPKDFPAKAALANLELLIEYRDNVIHFYNQPGFRVVVYSLAQTSVSNFNDLLESTMGHGLGKQLPGSLLPIGLEAPVDPVVFFRDVASGKAKASEAVSHFMKDIGQAVRLLEGEGLDTGALMTVFKVQLESAKKIESADLTVAVSDAADPTVVVKPQDPNRSHPYRQGDITKMKLMVGDTEVKQREFQALAFHLGWKGNPRYHWADASGAVQRYSPAVLAAIKKLKPEDLKAAVKCYTDHLRSRRDGLDAA